MVNLQKRWGLLVGMLWSISIGATETQAYDFQFRQMDFRKVILSIAALEKRSVQFTQGVVAKAIDVSLQGVTPHFAMKILTESYGYVYALKGNVYHVMTVGERGPSAAPMVLIPLKNVLVADIEDNVRSFLGSTGTVSTNKGMNSLIVSAPEEVMAHLRPILEQLDQETSQVYIEAKIVETSTTFSRSLGIEWGPNVDARPSVNGASFSAPGTNGSLRIGVSPGILGSALQARLKTGEQNGEVKIISQPKITTLNGVAANISSNITFNIRSLAATGSAASAVGGIQQVKAGLQLSVTPNIVSDKRVRLQIQVTKSDPDFSATIDGIPGVTDNSAATSLIVDSGQIASIAGLVSNRNSSTTSAVPFLNRLPIFGFLFGSDGKDHKETEMMIFLMPSIFKGSAKIEAFSLDERTVSDGVALIKPATAAVVPAVTTPLPILPKSEAVILLQPKESSLLPVLKLPVAPLPAAVVKEPVAPTPAVAEKEPAGRLLPWAVKAPVGLLPMPTKPPAVESAGSKQALKDLLAPISLNGGAAKEAPTSAAKLTLPKVLLPVAPRVAPSP